jgi:hypothetical protein
MRKEINIFLAQNTEEKTKNPSLIKLFLYQSTFRKKEK